MRGPYPGGGRNVFARTGLATDAARRGALRHWRVRLALNRERPDLTLDEIVLALHKRRISGSCSALSRFFARHGSTIKKAGRGGAKASRRGAGLPTLDPRARAA